MKRIEILEKIQNHEVAFADSGIHHAVYWAYRNSKTEGNALLNFNDVVWEQDVPQIVKDCRMLGIKKITISSNQSSLLETIWAFEREGCKFQKLTKVHMSYHNLFTGEKDTKIAAVIKIGTNDAE